MNPDRSTKTNVRGTRMQPGYDVAEPSAEPTGTVVADGCSPFTYSRWDGTQHGFDLDADSLFDELTDELLYHGDVNAALRRMMHDGLRDRDGEPSPGLRELLERLRQERQERLDRHDLGGVYDEIARELDDIIDEERHAIDHDRLEARQHVGAHRRPAPLGGRRRRRRGAAVPPRPAAGRPRRQGRELQRYDFESASAEAPSRGADGAPPRPAGQPDVRPDERGDAADDARVGRRG